MKIYIKSSVNTSDYGCDIKPFKPNPNYTNYSGVQGSYTSIMSPDGIELPILYYNEYDSWDQHLTVIIDEYFGNNRGNYDLYINYTSYRTEYDPEYENYYIYGDKQFDTLEDAIEFGRIIIEDIMPRNAATNRKFKWDGWNEDDQLRKYFENKGFRVEIVYN